MKYLLFLILPKACLSRWMGCLERLKKPKWLVDLAKVWFIQRYKLNMDEAEKSIAEYSSLNALFTRKLKEGSRPIRGELIHPCDGVISRMGEINDGALLQAKGWHYSADELIGRPVRAELEGGVFVTYYLCPTDYHRVHFPLSGKVSGIRHLVGKLWPVNSWSVHNVRNLFCVNERVVFEIQTSLGVVYMVMVGATNVGQITSHLVPELRTNRSCLRTPQFFDFSSEPKSIRVGEEAGIFEMGSTVIMLYPAPYREKLKLAPGAAVLGQSIV